MKKENKVSVNVFVEPHVREMMKERAFKKERYSDYIERLMEIEQKYREHVCHIE